LEGEALVGKSFVISGVFENFEREELKDKIIANGGKVVSSISSKLDFLLAGNNMGPAKLEKANQLNIKILNLFKLFLFISLIYFKNFIICFLRMNWNLKKTFLKELV
jgi:DNA ligase (NAD+)